MSNRDDNISQEVLEKKTSRRSFLKRVGTAAAGVAVVAATATIPRPAKADQKPAVKPAMKYLFAERQNCTGCRACEYACSLHHEGLVRPSMSRIHVLKYRGVVDVPVICWHCEDSPCIKACPTTPKALVKDPKTNGIKLDPKLCLGGKCNKCMEACPTQFVRRNPDNGMPLMCDMCGGDPECVKACNEQAGNSLGACLIAGNSGFGVNMAYRNITAEDAGADMIQSMFYPNEDGERKE